MTLLARRLRAVTEMKRQRRPPIRLGLRVWSGIAGGLAMVLAVAGPLFEGWRGAAKAVVPGVLGGLLLAAALSSGVPAGIGKFGLGRRAVRLRRTWGFVAALGWLGLVAVRLGAWLWLPSSMQLSPATPINRAGILFFTVLFFLGLVLAGFYSYRLEQFKNSDEPSRGPA